MKIRTILSRKGSFVATISPDKNVRDAVVAMAERNIGALVVLNESSRLVGIITERDVIRTAARNPDVLRLNVAEIMTSKVFTGMPQDDVTAVAQTMTDKRIRHLPIMQDDNLVGIVSIGDILKAQRDMYLGERDTLETQIMAED
jgi:CBS domain-containing protein